MKYYNAMYCGLINYKIKVGEYSSALLDNGTFRLMRMIRAKFFILSFLLLITSCRFATFHYRDIKTGQLVTSKDLYGQQRPGDTVLIPDRFSMDQYRIEAIDTLR